MQHKAFLFDYVLFEKKLKPILVESLKNGNVEHLREFIIKNHGYLKDPYEGERLDRDWEKLVNPKDPHQYGDFALTRFYDPKNDIGLGDSWGDLELYLGKKHTLLGAPLKSKNYFDPGKLGSYFQPFSLVKENLNYLKKMSLKAENEIPLLNDLVDIFKEAILSKKGLYVTF